MSDPRLGRPSASRLDILCLCPGSEQLRRTLPPEALESDDEYTEAGRKLHKAWETGSTFDLSESELEIYNNGIKTERQIIADWCQEFDITTFVEGERECRMYLHDPNTLQVVASGQLDAHYIAGVADSRVLVVDRKALWCPNLTPAERNYQGRLQAVLASIEYDARHVRMAFNKAMWGRQDSCDYDATSLQRARDSIFQSLWEAEQPGAQRRPGRWCLHCPCKAYCEDAATVASLPAITSSGGPLALVQTMPVEDLAVVWKKRGQIEKIFEAITNRLSALSDEQLSEIGLKKTAGKKLDKIKDVAGVVCYLRSKGISEGSLYLGMSFGKEKLVKLMADHWGVSEERAAQMFDSELDEFIERGRGKPFLVENK